MSDEKIDLEAELNQLFRASLKDFIQQRKDLVSRLKKSGDKEKAALVGAIAKPPLSAWAVNQLYWQHTSDFQKLLAAGDEIRRIQHHALAGQAPGGDLPSAQKQRQKAIDGLLRLAEIVLLQDGHAASQGVLKRISTTLEAAAAYGSEQPDPGPGRLRQDLDLPGFERLAELAALPPPPRTARSARAEPRDAEPAKPSSDRVRAARGKVELAEADFNLRQAEAKRAQSGLELAEDRVGKAKKELEQLRDQMARLEGRYRQAEADVKKARSTTKKARLAEQKARRSLEEARAMLEDLENPDR